MAYELKSAGVCVDCGCICPCLNCPPGPKATATAGRVRECAAIVTSLADSDPIVTQASPHDYECGLCGAVADRDINHERPDPYPHTATCLWLRARKYKAGE